MIVAGPLGQVLQGDDRRQSAGHRRGLRRRRRGLWFADRLSGWRLACDRCFFLRCFLNGACSHRALLVCVSRAQNESVGPVVPSLGKLKRIGTKVHCSGRKLVPNLNEFFVEASASQAIASGSLAEAIFRFFCHILCRPPTAMEGRKLPSYMLYVNRGTPQPLVIVGSSGADQSVGQQPQQRGAQCKRSESAACIFPRARSK